MKSGIKYTGYPSAEELGTSPGIPPLEALNKKTLAVVECFQCIPCNPCEKSCPFGAITIGDTISNLPTLNIEKCKGCCTCIPHCPGLAIFVVDLNFSSTTALVNIPYEVFPTPKEGSKVLCLNRLGEIVTIGTIHSVKITSGYDKTYIIAIETPKEYAMDVRNIKL